MKKVNWLIIVIVLIVVLFFIKFELYVYDKETGQKLGKLAGRPAINWWSAIGDDESLELTVGTTDIAYIGADGYEYWTDNQFVIVKKKLVFKLP